MSVYNLRLFFIFCYFLLPHHLTFFFDGQWPLFKPTDVICVLLLLLIPKRFNKNPIIILYFLFFLIYLYFGLLNYADITSLFVSVKLFQYLVVILNITAIRVNHLINIFKVILIFTVCTFVLFLLGFDIGPYWGQRFFSVYGGPYELAAIAVFSIIFLRRASILQNRRKHSFFYFVFLMFSKSKSGLLSVLVSRKRYIVGCLFILVILLDSVEFTNYESRLFHILSDFAVFFNADVISECANLPSFSSKAEYHRLFLLREVNSTIESLSASSSHRFVTTCTVLGSFDAWSLLFGFGPYVVGTVDNSVLRILSDVGLLGLILFFVFFCKLTPNWTLAERSALLVTFLLADVFFSARVIPYFYLCYLLNLRFRSLRIVPEGKIRRAG